jgi:hypothetical protein
MVLKEVRRVNAGSVAKRQQLRSNANARKAEEEARATEQVLAAAWSVGADNRRQLRDAEAEARARQRDARDDLKLSALRAESELTGDAPRIVNRKLQKKSQSADDLLGMALMEEACKAQRKRDKAAAAAAAAAQKTASPRGSRDVVFPDGDDMRDVPRNTNRDVDVDEARTLDDAVALLDSMSKSSASKSESNLAGLAKGMRRTGSSATLGARRGVRKVSSKSALFAMEANMEAIAIG